MSALAWYEHACSMTCSRSVTHDFLLVKPFRDRVAGLDRNVFTIERDCLTIDGSGTSLGGTGPAHKLPRTDFTRASKLPILG